MDLGKITARVRPRNPYEATDLGVVMARQWFRPLMLLWLLPSLPLMLLLFFVFRHQPMWALLILWWLKPLWETLQLQFIAEALFNPDVNWRDYLRKAPSLLWHQAGPKLLLQRWSPSRSFNMPVGELERLRGGERSRRLITLHRGAGAASLWLAVLGNTIEGVLVMALFALAWMFIPVQMSVDLELADVLDSPLLFPAIAWGGYLAMWIVAPFYVCCGFMLYINRRTWLEAWDIELTFRQLAARHAGGGRTAAAVLALCIALGGLGASPDLRADANDNTHSSASADADASANTTLSPEQSQQQIFEILESDDFNEIKHKTGYRWIDVSDEKKAAGEEGDEPWYTHFDWLTDYLQDSPTMTGLLDSLGSLPQLLEILLWGFAIALVVYLMYRFRHFSAVDFRRTRTLAKKTPTHLFGLELNQASLPDDVIAAARQLWQQQQHREALGLLYRAALSYLVFERHLPLDDSHTEDECVQLCIRQENPDRSAFFSLLTGHWVRQAYAHTPPDDAGFTQLCQQWPGFVQPEQMS